MPYGQTAGGVVAPTLGTATGLNPLLLVGVFGLGAVVLFMGINHAHQAKSAMFGSRRRARRRRR